MSNMNSQIIFYGAGQYARANLKRLVSEGLIPLCFVDKNPHKHHTKLDGYDILPLSEAVSKYPNYVLYLTLTTGNLLEATEYLLANGITSESIKYVEPTERRLGCMWLDGVMQITSQYFYICCHPIRAKGIQYNNLKDCYEKYQSTITQLIDDLRNKKRTFCNGCEYLRDGIWSAKLELRNIIFQGDFEDDLCNFNCLYCITKPHLLKKNEKRKNLIDVIYQISKIDELKGINLDFANGEVTARRDFDQLLQLVQDNGFTVSFVTNGSIYKQNIVDLIHCGLVSYINVSLDSGTAETFAKIKGVDCFKKVVDNLERYYEAGANIYLKYILLEGLNDNELDIDSFVDIAAKIKANVWLSADLFKRERERELNSHSMDMCLRFIKNVKTHNLNISYDPGCFHRVDVEKINDFLTK